MGGTSWELGMARRTLREKRKKGLFVPDMLKGRELQARRLVFGPEIVDRGHTKTRR